MGRLSEARDTLRMRFWPRHTPEPRNEKENTMPQVYRADGGDFRRSTGISTNPYDRNHPRYGVTQSFPAPRAPLFAPRRLKPRIVKALACAACAAVALFAGSALLHAAGTSVPANGEMAQSGQTSTPISQWKAGAMPLLLQTDPTWGDKPYAGGTVAENGCGPTSLTMVYVYLTGRTDYDPASMCAFSEQNGYVDQGATAWLLMSEGANMLGLTSRELPADASAVTEALASGEPVVCSVGPGDFTTEGHFIVLSAIDDAGQVTVYDPNSAERSNRTWDVQTVLNQCRNLWAFSK